MGDFDQLLRDGVALAKQVVGTSGGLMTTVTQRPVTARDTYQKPTARATADVTVLLEDSKRLIRLAGGVDKEARHKLTFLENASFDTNDTDFVLPDGTVGVILDVKGPSD